MRNLFCVFLAVLLLFTACSPRTAETPSESEASGVEASVTETSVNEISVSEAEPEAVSSESASESGVSGESDSSEEPAPPLTFKLVIPEGYTLARIGMVLEEKGVCTADEFIEASQSDFSQFPLVAARYVPARSTDAVRCFKLEGYLFPDTYELYYEDSPYMIISKILEHTEQKISAELRSEIAASGYTVDDILTMASIIEKEAFGAEHMQNISSVLHNRLDSGMRLQCDVTITYVEGAIKPFITGDKDRYNSHYNTYKCASLPAGAICNPGLAAIKAAVNPADTDYLYFVTDSDNNYYFAATWEEHEKNVAVAMGDKDE